jgi:hypothetical protein
MRNAGAYNRECPRCGSTMYPIWFEDEETRMIFGSLHKTGRKRLACSHFECPCCFHKECVDDSFDGEWH